MSPPLPLPPPPPGIGFDVYLSFKLPGEAVRWLRRRIKSLGPSGPRVGGGPERAPLETPAGVAGWGGVPWNGREVMHNWPTQSGGVFPAH